MIEFRNLGVAGLDAFFGDEFDGERGFVRIVRGEKERQLRIERGKFELAEAVVVLVGVGGDHRDVIARMEGGS